MTTWAVRQVLRGIIIVLALLSISGPDRRERRRFMIESSEFSAAFDAALTERYGWDKLEELAGLCTRSPSHLDHLRGEAQGPDGRRALLATTARFWIENESAFVRVVNYLTESAPDDVFPEKAGIPVNGSDMVWRVKAVVKHMGAEACVPLLALVARYPGHPTSRGAIDALSLLWDAQLMDRPIFAVFSDPSYSDTYRLSIAVAFAPRSSLAYGPALREMLIEKRRGPSVPYDIVETLGRIHDKESIPILRSIFLDGKAKGALRREALLALDALEDSEVMDLSLRVYPSLALARRDDETVYAGITQIFARHGDAKVIPLLEKLTTNRPPFDDLAYEANEGIKTIRHRLGMVPRRDSSSE